MTDDPTTTCATPWAAVIGEEEQDWVLNLGETYAYNSNSRKLTISIKRALVGSANDYTFRLNRPYEYAMVSGIYDGADQEDAKKAIGKAAPTQDKDGNVLTLKFLPA